MRIVGRDRAVSVKPCRFITLVLAVLLCAIAPLGCSTSAQEGPTHYVRYALGSMTSFGILEGETIRELDGDLFENPQPTGQTHALSEVELLLPLDPMKISKIVGIAVNDRGDNPRPVIRHHGLFAKFPTGLVGDGSEIEFYPESTKLIWEAELVVVIGKKGRHIPLADAPDHIFGYAAGHDVSENDWWGERAGTDAPGKLQGKASDGYAGISSAIVAGVDYRELRVKATLNGQVVSDVLIGDRFINTPERLVSYISRYITLLPGDLIYMGTFFVGRDMNHVTSYLLPGDRIEIEIPGVGKLTQTVVPVNVPPPNLWQVP